MNKTVFNHGPIDLHVFVGDTPRLVPARCGREFAAAIAEQMLAQARKDALPLSADPLPQGAGGDAARQFVELLAQGPVISLSLLDRKNLLLLERATLLRIAQAVNAPGPIPEDATKAAVVEAILAAAAPDAGSSSGRTAGLAPANSGSTPDPATISPDLPVAEPQPPASEA